MRGGGGNGSATEATAITDEAAALLGVEGRGGNAGEVGVATAALGAGTVATAFAEVVGAAALGGSLGGGSRRR